MKKLTETQLKSLAAHRQQIDTTTEVLTARTDAFNLSMEKRHQALRERIEQLIAWGKSEFALIKADEEAKYTAAVEAARGFVGELAGKAEKSFMARSAKWQETDAGVAYLEWAGDLRDIAEFDIEFELTEPDFSGIFLNAPCPEIYQDSIERSDESLGNFPEEPGYTL